MHAMARPKGFSRDSVLDKAVSLFWRNGFAGTTLNDLAVATGLNKSSLYAEFQSKDELFLASMRHYLANRAGGDVLTAQPLGWANIERFLLEAPSCLADRSGCFAVSSTRELAILPPQAATAMAESRRQLTDLIKPNVVAERPETDVDAVCKLIWTFFSGLCIELNRNPDAGEIGVLVENFMAVLRRA